jgi:hypothetical protein
MLTRRALRPGLMALRPALVSLRRTVFVAPARTAKVPLAIVFLALLTVTRAVPSSTSLPKRIRNEKRPLRSAFDLVVLISAVRSGLRTGGGLMTGGDVAGEVTND